MDACDGGGGVFVIGNAFGTDGDVCIFVVIVSVVQQYQHHHHHHHNLNHIIYV